MFTVCRQLKELELDVRHVMSDKRAALRAIIRSKLRLKMLKLVNAFDDSDAGWFRQQVKDQQVLPVPAIIITAEHWNPVG